MLAGWLASLAAVPAAVLALPLVSDLLSLLSPRRPAPRAEPGVPERYVVLVPAHNESPAVGDCVRALRQAASGDALVDIAVIADRCTDDTASVARAAGATALERRDGDGGKPAAIGWALAQGIAADADAVIIVDADTRVHHGFLAAVRAAGPWRQAAAQARQLPRSDDGWLARLTELFSSGRYDLAYPLKQRAGLNCPLTGTGMVLGMDAAGSIRWNALGLAEDMEIYARLTAEGRRIGYIGDAVVSVEEETVLDRGTTQRRRWTAGRYLAAWRGFGGIVRSRALRIRQKLDACAELTAPGPIEHALCVLILSGLLWLAAQRAAILMIAILLGTLVRPATYALLALPRQPDPARTMLAALMLPVYALWRLAALAGTPAVMRNRRWTGTRANGGVRG